jgi:lipoprotein NlpI
MKYQIDKITQSEAVKSILAFLSSDFVDGRLKEAFHSLQEQYQPDDKSDPIWLMFMYVQEYVTGDVPKEEALAEVLALADEHHFLINNMV